jgi:hypothetical protein
VKPFAASETGTFGAGQWAGRFLRKADPPEKGPASEMKPMSPATSDKSDNVGRHLATRALTATNTLFFIREVPVGGLFITGLLWIRYNPGVI